MSAPRKLGAFARLAALAALAFTGCFSDPTEVVVVVDTDATVRDFVQMQISTTAGFGRGGLGDMVPMEILAYASPTPLPVTLGLTPGQGRTPSTFDVIVDLVTVNGAVGAGAFLHRKVSNIDFVPDQMMTLFIPMLSICSSNGTTSFPNALDDDCRDVTAPVLTKFDEEDIPHLSKPVAATP